MNVSQQALSQLFLTFPSELFEKVFKDLLPHLRAAWHNRNQRPLPESIQFSLAKFSKIWIVDSSTVLGVITEMNSSSTFDSLVNKLFEEYGKKPIA